MQGQINTSLERTFEILELFDTEQRALSLKEIVDWLGYPTSTTAAILRSLVQLGYIQHDRSSRTYIPTTRLAYLATWSVSKVLPGEPVLAAIRQLCSDTGELIYLAHRNDIRVQYLHVERGTKVVQTPQRVGVTRLLVHTALGWALMSLLDDRGNQSIIRRTNSMLSATDAVDPDTVLRSIQACRDQGFCMSEHTIRLGHGVIASPIAIGNRHYSIGVAAPTTRLAEHGQRYAALVCEAVQSASVHGLIDPPPRRRHSR